MPSEHARQPREADVILDVEFDHGLLFLVLRNLGESPAHSVRVRFERPFHGLGGDRRIDRLGVFRRLEFLGPRRRLRVFLDRSSLYFARDEPRTLSARVAWRTDEGARRSRTITHDLDAYRDFPYLEVPADAHRPS